MAPAFPPIRRILVTGFEPFGGREVNPSAVLVHELETAGPGIEGVELRACVLPVVYAEVEAAFARAADFFQPDIVLCFGLNADQKETIRIERIAVNLDDNEGPDNAGEVRARQAIRPDGGAALRATAPVGLLRDSLRAARIPTRTSNSAGSFLCNHLLYYALDRAEAHRLGQQQAYRCGFFHLPLLEDITARDLLHAVHVMIHALVTDKPHGRPE